MAERKITETFGSMVFGDQIMREKLPAEVYKALRRTMQNGRSLDPQLAGAVANAMRDWAVERGATHYTHWFQPMTGITAEKHDSFIWPEGNDRVILDFSGKELIRGEPDASSFPSGGLRATFEARGYTAWDPTSYAFIKDGTLCIPTAFCSYTGQALDKKTPLLRSMEAINRQALRVLRALGDTTTKNVIAMVGAEQEYFLLDLELYNRRKDLKFTGRTLFGAKPPKGQEMDDHYFGSIKTRVAAFMRELDEELWKLGVPAKTEHNEAAPQQHELASVYTTANIATDHNQIIMEMMKKVAERHGMACLLHEKPFAGVNGSGKHNNWSLATNDGRNLLDTSKLPPHENLPFLLFLCAVMKAADEHQDLLRVSIAGAGNDHRLGASEAPPAIVSVFLGDELTTILESIEKGCEYSKDERGHLETGVHVLPHFAQDTTDRNRTSPLAFTGNKFEFRMPGASQSIAEPNIILNTIIAEALACFADTLESSEDTEAAMRQLICDTVRAHKRIIFNGNNYAEEWVEEAARRGLLNLRTTADALPYFVSDKNIHLFEKHHVFTPTEMRSRQEILYENYGKVIHIEALTMLDMARQAILPSAMRYQKALSDMILAKRAVSDAISTGPEETLLILLSGLCESLADQISRLEKAVQGAGEHTETQALADYYRDAVLPSMAQLRVTADQIEQSLADDYQPYPTYAQMLFSL
ncbi:glutamine synthetase III [Eubacteriales bacterium OttesenSCG-928-A19]|nr:glutamine synthetase III [Eubacteriales bacterium OttesenSCG-928-A19]